VAEPKPEDEAPPEIGDHPFEPRGKWWSLCKICGLARASHATSTIDTRLEMLKDQMERYGEIRHVDPKRKTELDREFRDLERTRVHSGGRARIGYVGDDDDD
jgi:hypothetical protein